MFILLKFLHHSATALVEVGVNKMNIIMSIIMSPAKMTDITASSFKKILHCTVEIIIGANLTIMLLEKTALLMELDPIKTLISLL